MCLHQHTQNILYTPVEVALTDDTRLDAIEYLAQLALGTWHQHVVADTDLSGAIFLGPPVSHHKTVVAPFITQQVFQQPTVF